MRGNGAGARTARATGRVLAGLLVAATALLATPLAHAQTATPQSLDALFTWALEHAPATASLAVDDANARISRARTDRAVLEGPALELGAGAVHADETRPQVELGLWQSLPVQAERRARNAAAEAGQAQTAANRQLVQWTLQGQVVRDAANVLLAQRRVRYLEDDATQTQQWLTRIERAVDTGALPATALPLAQQTQLEADHAVQNARLDLDTARQTLATTIGWNGTDAPTPIDFLPADLALPTLPAPTPDTALHPLLATCQADVSAQASLRADAAAEGNWAPRLGASYSYEGAAGTESAEHGWMLHMEVQLPRNGVRSALVSAADDALRAAEARCTTEASALQRELAQGWQQLARQRDLVASQQQALLPLLDAQANALARIEANGVSDILTTLELRRAQRAAALQLFDQWTEFVRALLDQATRASSHPTSLPWSAP